MTRVAPPWISALLAASAVVAFAAAPEDIQLPPETVRLRPSKLPGFEIATQKCSICHSADYIAYQPPRMNQAQWTAEVTKMHATYGAPIDTTEIKLVGIYLTAAYGDTTSIGADDLALPAPTGGPEATAAIDVQALLDKNACLGCHSRDQKIVGPAYRDVATKYRADPQALAKIEASIAQGGAGRWGSVPMPPFPGLSEPQLKALAGFVLGQ
jgi:cytochrome c551/c552